MSERTSTQTDEDEPRGSGCRSSGGPARPRDPSQRFDEIETDGPFLAY